MNSLIITDDKTIYDSNISSSIKNTTASRSTTLPGNSFLFPNMKTRLMVPYFDHQQRNDTCCCCSRSILLRYLVGAVYKFCDAAHLSVCFVERYLYRSFRSSQDNSSSLERISVYYSYSIDSIAPPNLVRNFLSQFGVQYVFTFTPRRWC